MMFPMQCIFITGGTGFLENANRNLFNFAIFKSE